MKGSFCTSNPAASRRPSSTALNKHYRIPAYTTICATTASSATPSCIQTLCKVDVLRFELVGPDVAHTTCLPFFPFRIELRFGSSYSYPASTSSSAPSSTPAAAAATSANRTYSFGPGADRYRWSGAGSSTLGAPQPTSAASAAALARSSYPTPAPSALSGSSRPPSAFRAPSVLLRLCCFLFEFGSYCALNSSRFFNSVVHRRVCAQACQQRKAH